MTKTNQIQELNSFLGTNCPQIAMKTHTGVLRKTLAAGGNVAKAARKELESKLSRSVISSAKASDYLPDSTSPNEIE